MTGGPESAAHAGAVDGAAPVVRRVVVVVAHPDDETLTAGGLVALLAARVELTLVTCTRGERGEVIGADLAHLADRPEELADHRLGELERALVALGVSQHLFLDTVGAGAGVRRYVDSGMTWDEAGFGVRAVPAPDAGADAFSVVDVEGPVADLVAVLDRTRPDLVVVDEPGGGYGHPDHRRAHEVTMLAVARAAHRPALVAWPVRPATVVRQAQAWLREQGDRPDRGADGGPLTLAEADGALPSIAVPDPDVDVEIDVEAQLPAVVAAMAAHRSQVQAVGLVPRERAVGAAVGWYALSNGVLQPILRRSWLRAAPGWGDPRELAEAVGRLGTAPAMAADGGSLGAGRWYRPTMIAFSLVLGVVLAAVGTAFHRAYQPWGLVVALLGLAAGGVLARTFVDRLGQVVLGVAAVATVLVMTYVRPGADVLVTDQPIGIAWIAGSMLAALLLPALAPRRWFGDGDG